MHALIVEPGKAPREKDIDSSLKGLQKEVGGYIEALYPYADQVAIVCNEEGKLNGLPLNRGLYDEDGDLCDIIAGKFLIVGLGEEDFDSLNPELMEKYAGIFAVPECFAKIGNDIIAMPIE